MAAPTITESMTLDEKLAAIDAAPASAKPKVNAQGVEVPADPADLTMCIGCQ